MTAALVIELIAKVGWPAAQYLIGRYGDPAPWGPQDTRRVQSIIDVPASAFEKEIQPIQGS